MTVALAEIDFLRIICLCDLWLLFSSTTSDLKGSEGSEDRPGEIPLPNTEYDGGFLHLN